MATLSYILSLLVSMIAGYLTPLIPLYMVRYGASQTYISIVATISQIGYIILAIMSNKLISKLGLKVTIIISLITCILPLSILLKIQNILLLTASIILFNFSLGIFWPTIETYVSILKGRAETFSLSWSGGMIIGAYISSLGVLLDERTALILPTLILIASFLISIFNREVKITRKHHPESRDIRIVLKRGRIIWIATISYGLIQGIILIIYPPYISKRGIWLPLIGISLGTYTFTRTLIFYISKKITISQVKMTLIGIFLLGISSFLISQTINPAVTIILAILGGLGAGLDYIGAINMAFHQKENKHTYMSLFEATIGLGYLLGFALSAIISPISESLPFYLTLVYSLLATLLIKNIKSKT